LPAAAGAAYVSSMGGTLLNMATVLAGGLAGLAIGQHLPERLRGSLIGALGLITLFLGIGNAGRTANPLVLLVSVLAGAIIGELLDLDAALARLAALLQRRIGESQARRGRFVTGFVTASLVFCVGPLTLVGSMLDGMGEPLGFQQLAIKSALDFFSSLAFAASFGVGVLFSLVTIFLVQGSLALAGHLFGRLLSPAMVDETVAVGGILLIGLALLLLEVKQLRMANFLPALVIAPILVALAGWLGLAFKPVIP
jgi:uncharacterized membrane protein YqgA involved in biofilm formation